MERRPWSKFSFPYFPRFPEPEGKRPHDATAAMIFSNIDFLNYVAITWRWSV